MGLRRTSLVLYILFIFHLQHHFHSVNSRPSSVDTNHETLPFNDSKPDVLGFEGKARELVVVIKRGGGGGRGGGGRSGGRSSRGGGGGSSNNRGGESGDGGGRNPSRGGAGVIPIRTGAGGSAGSHHSSGSRNIRGTVCVVGWLALSVLAGLFLVQ